MEDTSLLIEGGGMRGFFSCGVLQCFLDNGLQLDYVIGISSGSLNAVGYVTHNLQSFFTYAKNMTKTYIQLQNLIFQDRGLLDTDRFFTPTEADFHLLKNAPGIMKIGTTRAKDAGMVYFEKSDFKSPEDMKLKLRASAAIPILMPKTIINGEVYVDGGIIDSIPLKEAQKDGKKKHIVVVTRPKGYRKGRQALGIFLHRWLRPFPELRQAMVTRHIRYNEALDELDRLEANGEALVIRPLVNRLGRTEFNLKKFRSAYDDGYQIARSQLDKIRQFLNLPQEEMK